MKIQIIVKGFVVALVICCTSCAKDRVNFVAEQPLQPSDCTDTISYIQQVRPIIEQNCSTSGCHDATSSGGYEFLTYSNVSLHSEIMLKSMKHEQGPSNMPLGLPKLNDSLIKTFECWIMQGVQNN